MPKDKEKGILNSKLKDSSSKIIFEDNILCSQFLRDYVDLPQLKNVKPEDIEDVSEQFVPLFSEERNADRVKKVLINSEIPFFLISLIEHKTQIDYNVSMQIFRYMIYIWDAYEKEAEKLQPGCSKRQDFRYPPVLPIVYYEGSHKWTVPLSFLTRIQNGKAFKRYLPDFQYYLVPLRDYSNEELLAKEDEISLVMLINKMQTGEDVENFRKLPKEKVEAILQNSPQQLVDIIAKVLLAFLLKESVPSDEAEELVSKVKEKKMAELFANMEKIDIQAERRNTEEQRKRADQQQKRADEAEEKGIRCLVEAYQEVNVSQDLTIQKLMEKFQLSKEQSQEKIDLYWK